MHSLIHASQAPATTAPPESRVNHPPVDSGATSDIQPGRLALESTWRRAKDSPRVEHEPEHLDLLVEDIARLARSYVHHGHSGGIAPSAGGASPAPAGRPVAALGDQRDTGVGVSTDAGSDMLDAVCDLLGSVLHRMRGCAAVAKAGAGSRAAAPRPRGGIAPSALCKVRAHIDQNLGERVEIAALAAITGLSPCHFSRAFKQSMGMPPHRYVTSRRIQEAARLIEATDKPMLEIALDVGFSDQSHFTRVFSAQVGESPGQFRHQRR